MRLIILFVGLLFIVTCCAETITPSVYWKSQIDLPNEPFQAEEISASEPGWVKFTTLILAGYDPNTVYFQDSKEYVFHYDFATELLDPFIGMSTAEYNQVSLYETGQQAALGAVIVPGDDTISEYGIQFIRHDPYLREEIRDMFNAVKAGIIADPNTEAFYFPTFEQLATAEANSDWFEGQGIVVSSPSRWTEGNACYSSGWALGELKYFSSSQVETAYLSGELLPGDILLTDGVPAELPYVAGILSLSPSTPNSHVAILAKTFNVPFAHLAIAEDANNAQQLVGKTVLLFVADDGGVCSVGLRDLEGLLTAEEIEAILALKKPPQLDISPIAYLGTYSENTSVLTPSDANHFGGKASNFGLLRTSIPDNSPKAAAISFDLWNDFLDQPLTPSASIIIEPGEHLLFWADDEEYEGPMHTNFKLDKDGFNDDIGLFDSDGVTLIDSIAQFPPQGSNVSYGRSDDGVDNWVYFSGGTASPNQPNGGTGGPTEGLFINEFMADNDTVITDNVGDYHDWIEVYNAGSSAVDLGGMYLTDTLAEPSKWMIPYGITGGTLREEINNRLSAYTTYPPDMAALSADLSAIRNMIRNSNVTSFSAGLQAAMIAALTDPQYGFEPDSKLRFRSSTNVEDSDQFTGAGLYSSYSGCLADELDADNVGPCLCDPTEPDERGVFRAIRRTFASFYNDNAFLERLRHDVNESDVGMAMLVHHSFPDEIELANGVAALEKNDGDPNMYITLITQAGAISVTNPIDDSIPEEVSIVYVSPSQVSPTLVRGSSLVILGETVMDWQNDYSDLSELLALAAAQFQQVTGKTNYILDFEYKKVAPGGTILPAGGLVVKQIRQIPQPDNTPDITTPFLVNENTEYCTFQGESGNVFANHRLKSKWILQTKNIWLTGENLEQSLYTNATVEYAADGRIRNLSATPSLLPFAAYTFDGEDTLDNWLMHHLSNTRSSGLRTDNIPTQLASGENPVITLSDFGFSPGYLRLYVDYNEPVPSMNWMGPTTTTTDSIRLCPCSEADPNDLLQQRTTLGSSGESITTTFYWPQPPEDISLYTAPLKRFVETVIDGYTTEPIVLNGYYSQTYWPDHHNWNDIFIFEPQLEPGISQNILDELRTQDIKFFLMDHYKGTITTYGFGTEPFNPADIDGDDDADIMDLGLFSTRWLDTVCDDCSGADLTGDGRVMMDDFLEFANNWLAEASYL